MRRSALLLLLVCTAKCYAAFWSLCDRVAAQMDFTNRVQIFQTPTISVDLPRTSGNETVPLVRIIRGEYEQMGHHLDWAFHDGKVVGADNAVIP